MLEHPATDSLALPAAVPLAPVLSCAALRRRPAQATPSLPCVLDAGAVRLVTSGRVAIALALREMRLEPGDKMLMPAYHSMSMIAPLAWLGIEPVFYKVGPDTAVDLADVEARIGAGVKALLVTHYFGFPQDLSPIRALCDRHGIMLVEDCAHCFFGSYQGRPVGAWGDYAVASSMKFYPAYEGGCLVSARHRLRTRLRGAGAGFEAKAALAALERSFAHRRLAPLQAALRLPLRLKDALWRRARAAGDGAPLAPSSSDSSYEFDPHWLDKRSSLFSRALLRLLPRAAIVARRRANYARLEQALAGLPGCRPLFAQLPADACPWMFPLLLEEPEAPFARLQARRVPVTRFAETLWPGVDARTCANSAALSRRVLAFPCHQELRPAELEWVAAEVREALAA